MGAKLRVTGLLAVGALAGALTTLQFQAVARSSLAPMPLEELQQLAAVFDIIKTDYVEPVDEKKLIADAIAGMVAGLDPHSQYFDKKSYRNSAKASAASSSASASRWAWKTAWSRWCRRSKARPPSAPA
jgi:carboxyl-terminal processing protease